MPRFYTAQYSSLNSQLIVWILAFAYLVSLFKLKWGPSYTKIGSTPECYSIKARQPELCIMSYFALNVSHSTRIPYRHLRNNPTPQKISTFTMYLSAAYGCILYQRLKNETGRN
jgi:hypothetical protein